MGIFVNQSFLGSYVTGVPEDDNLVIGNCDTMTRVPLILYFLVSLIISDDDKASVCKGNQGQKCKRLTITKELSVYGVYMG